MRIEPIEDRVVIVKDEVKTTTEEGLHIPETAQEEEIFATVMWVGPGAFERGERVPMQCTIGDRVIVAKYAGSDVEVNDVTYTILRECDILGIIREW